MIDFEIFKDFIRMEFTSLKKSFTTAFKLFISKFKRSGAIAPNAAVLSRPHCHFYTDGEGNVASMIIICGRGLNFIFNKMQHPSGVFIKLIAKSYVFDFIFPGHYGL